MIRSAEGWEVYDTDSVADYQTLLEKSPTGTAHEVWQRDRKRYPYGSLEFEMEYGVPPIEAVGTSLLDPSEYKDAVEFANNEHVMPLHYTYEWRPKGDRYNQDGIGYCWTWSATGALMTCRACEDKPLVYLAPVSMGYLVRWANRGNYLGSVIKGLKEDGVYPGKSKAVLNDHSRSASKWPFDDNRAAFRLDEVWDLNPGSMTQQCLTALCAGRSIQVAYNWWGHALELVGVRYNGSTLEWIISNSHNEDDFIILTGNRAIPDEAYAFVSTKSIEIPDGFQQTDTGLLVPEGIAT